MKRTLLIILSLLLIISLAACQKAVEPAADTPAETVVEPATTEETKAESTGAPERIISLAPSMTETVYALGQGDKLVGRTDYCEFPAEVSQVESVGSMLEPDVEKIISLKPDVVLVASFFKEELLDKIRSAGIEIVIVEDAPDVAAIYEQLELVGKAIGAEEQAAELVKKMKERVQAVVDKVSGEEVKSAYYCVGFGEAEYAATGETFINDMIQLAGGRNIAEAATGWSYNLESLLKEDPQVIIMADEFDMKKNFMADEKYAALTAVKEDHVFEVDTDIIQIQGPRVVEGIEAMAKILHPEKF